MTIEAVKKIVMEAEELVPLAKPYLHVYTSTELLGLDIPPREYALFPILPKAGLAMLYAPRGVGKTWVSLGIACAVAAGAPFLRWRAEKPRCVLYVDGEMPAVNIQERLAITLNGMAFKPASPDLLRIITPDAQTGQMPDLAKEEGQVLLEPHLSGVDLVIIDNLACLVRSGKSNEEEGWRPIQTWALELRRRGIAVLFIHHAGKGGDQRGSSAREDILDTVIRLSRPDDYDTTQGARFVVDLTKARGISGSDAASFEACLEQRDQAANWTTRSVEDALTSRILALSDEGLKQREIARDLGIGLGTVNRHLKRAKGE